MAIKAFDRRVFDTGIDVLANTKIELENKVDKKTLDVIDLVGCLLTDARDCICYEKTSIPEGYNVDYEIRDFFKKIHEAVKTKTVDNSIIQNLRDVGDSPTWIFEIFTSYLLGYTQQNPAPEYLEEKRIEITKWLKEIKEFGYKPQE
jgi:hypothetical protein